MNKKSFISSGVVAILGILTLAVAYKSIDDAVKQKEEIIRLSEEKVLIQTPKPTQAQALMTDTEPIYYLVKSKDGNLKLYLVEQDIKKEIKSIEISEEMLPEEDRSLLKEGIKAMTLEEGVEIMENFIS